MKVIICAKYKKNPSRTVDATEWTRFSKSRPSDLEDIGQGQRSSHATHPFMLLIICTKYRKNPSWTADATGLTQKVKGQTDRQTDGQTDRVNPIYPPYFVAGGIIIWTALLICLKNNKVRVISNAFPGTNFQENPLNLLVDTTIGCHLCFPGCIEAWILRTHMSAGG